MAFMDAAHPSFRCPLATGAGQKVGTAAAVSEDTVQPSVSHGTQAMAHVPRSQVRPGMVCPGTEWDFGLPDQGGGLASQNWQHPRCLSARHLSNSGQGWMATGSIERSQNQR